MVRAASCIDNGGLPLVGVSSDRSKRAARLASLMLNEEMSDEQLEEYLLQLYKNQVKFRDHSRLEVDVLRGDRSEVE